jgi:DNA transformation protein
MFVKKRPKRPMQLLRSSTGFETFALDQLAELGGVTSRKMFGGVGLYCDGLFFGLIARDELYLKVDDASRGAFEAAGSTAFQPYRDRPGTMQYYSVPVGVLESSPELVRWAGGAVAAARRSGKVGKRDRRRE